MTNADYYEVYKKEEGSSYEMLKRLSSSNLKLSDSYVYNGKKYSYMIKAYDGSMYSTASSKLLAATSEDTIMFVAGPTVTSISAYYARTDIKWKPVIGAESYEVYYRYANGEWTCIGTTTGTSFSYNKTSPSSYDDYSVVACSKGYKSDNISVTTRLLSDQYVDINGVRYYLGEKIGDVTENWFEKFYGNHGEIWYIYGSGTYAGFVALGVIDDTVVEIITAGKGFNYKGMVCGSSMISGVEQYGVVIATDKNDSNIVHAVRIFDPNIDSFESYETEAKKLSGESKLIYHLTNAFRVYHGKDILSWCNVAAESSRLHSQDMADNNYVAHESLDGRQPWDRMAALGINYVAAGENISAGYYSGFDAYNSWVNSSGHRDNLLDSRYTRLGVGIAYNANSTYKMYHTPNFYSRW